MNTAGDEDLEYLCDGIAESLIQQVSKLRSFRVRPLGVVLDFKGPKGDPQAAGRQLGVETVLAGTLERQVARLRISARLVDVATGRQLWTSTYDRDAATLLDVQDEIASAIMDDGLRVRLTNDERAAARAPSDDRRARPTTCICRPATVSGSPPKRTTSSRAASSRVRSSATRSSRWPTCRSRATTP